MTEEEEDKPPGHPTPLIRARGLEELFGFSEIYLKYEGDNETGTHKDRIARLHVERAVNLGYDTLTAGTCGNYGVALAHYSRVFGIEVKIFIPSSYRHTRVEEMRRLGAEVVAIPRKYEEATELSARFASEKGWYDANPGPKNREPNYSAYAQISREILEELGESPTAVAVPIGNGTTLAGMYYGFKDVDKDGVLNGMPRMIAASTAYGNPIVTSFLQGLDYVLQLSPSNVIETEFNEPLVSYKSYDGEDALNAIRETRGYAFPVTDTKMFELSHLIRIKEGLDVLPASTSALEALRLFVRVEPHNSKYVVVLTGGKPSWRKR
ncbi:MAG: pyridoxal-phosphate dependent enzyme [Candidatus Bathyarchaeia archaeon]